MLTCPGVPEAALFVKASEKVLPVGFRVLSTRTRPLQPDTVLVLAATRISVSLRIREKDTTPPKCCEMPKSVLLPDTGRKYCRPYRSAGTCRRTSESCRMVR